MTTITLEISDWMAVSILGLLVVSIVLSSIKIYLEVKLFRLGSTPPE